MAEARNKKVKAKRYYVRGSTVPFEEDILHEFKGHRNISVEDLPPWTQASKTEKASRRAVSRTLNAFLNTGKGGTVYLGIVDTGKVRGIQLTQYQKDHVVGSLDDLFSRYRPPVKKHRYKVKFIPVVDTDCEGEELKQQCNFDSSSNIDPTDRLRPHQFRTHSYCWCDKEAVGKYNCGVISPDYIIEIRIKAWESRDQCNQGDGCGMMINLHPVHEDEEGSSYFRRQASLVQYTMTELAQLTRQEVQQACEEEIQQLRSEIAFLQAKNAEQTPEWDERKQLNMCDLNRKMKNVLRT